MMKPDPGSQHFLLTDLNGPVSFSTDPLSNKDSLFEESIILKFDSSNESSILYTMFVSANSAAKMADEITRMQKRKEKAKMVKLGLIEDSPSVSSNKGMSKSLRAGSSASFASSGSLTSSVRSSGSGNDDFLALLDIKKADIVKAEAKYAVKKAIAKQESELVTNEAHTKRLAEMALMRFNCNNKIGAVLSMKQLKAAQAEKLSMNESLVGLNKLLEEVEAGAINPAVIESRIQEVIENEHTSSDHSSSSKESYDDCELLNELASGKIELLAQRA